VHYDRARARPGSHDPGRRPVSGAALAASIPAPSIRQLELGPLEIRLYALCILAGIVVATLLTMARWRARGGNPELVFEVALWSVLAGLVGGRLYHLITSSDQVGDEWWAPFAIWEGGLGIWGAILFGVAAGALVTRLKGASVVGMMDAAAPGILIAQAIGRLGNYFNQELFGSPTDLPWALEVDLQYRPEGYLDTATFHPTFLYELIWNLAAAMILIWIGRRFRVRAPGIFALYVAFYCAGRVIWEQLRIDPSQEFYGQRLNFYVAVALLAAALAAFALIQLRRAPKQRVLPQVPRRAGGSHAKTARPKPRSKRR
jgi:prolipoprotein diacylglyceryl transferase